MIYFLIMYLCIVIIYTERNKNNNLMDFGLFLIALLIPIFGLIIVVMYNLNKSENVVYEFEEEREKEIDDLDNFLLKNSHSNFEANLILKSYKEARKEIVNFSKLSVDENSKLYMKALKSDDTEVTHMAAASLMKVKQKFEKKLVIANNIQLKELEEYIITLDEYVRNKLVHGVLKNNMIKTVVELAEKIIKFQNDKIEYFIAYINLLLEIENYDLATEYAEQLVYIWPNNENSWLVMFNTLIKAKNKEKLEEKILEYEKNNFEHSEQISKFISFWR